MDWADKKAKELLYENIRGMWSPYLEEQILGKVAQALREAKYSGEMEGYGDGVKAVINLAQMDLMLNKANRAATTPPPTKE